MKSTAPTSPRSLWTRVSIAMMITASNNLPQPSVRIDAQIVWIIV